MQSEKTNKIINAAGIFSALIFIYFSVVPYAVAGKNISIGLMFFSLFVLLLRKQITFPEISWLSGSVWVVIGLALFSAILSPYAIDSLNELRKDGAPFVLAFILLVCAKEIKTDKIVKMVMLALILGYSTKELLAIYSGVANGSNFNIYETPGAIFPKYLEFFASDSPYYLPFLLGPLFFWSMSLFQRLVILLLVSLAVLVVILSGVRTSFVLLVFSLALVVAYRFWAFKKTILLLVIFATMGGYVLNSELINSKLGRYTTVFSLKTYKFGGDASLSDRYAITKAVWDVSQDRLLVGYGAGWKKLPRVAEEKGHMDRWSKSDQKVDQIGLNYFRFGEGRVNPHNLFMSIFFEGGVMGLAAYLSLMLAVGSGFLKVLIGSHEPLWTGVAVAGLIHLMVTIGGSISGGTWLSVTMLVSVVCLARYQYKCNSSE